MVGIAILIVSEVIGARVGFEDVLRGVDEEAAGAGGRIADALAGARIDELDHHADDVARRAELAALPGGVQLAEQIFVEVALHVLVLAGNLHVVYGLGGLDQQAGLVDLELGIGHLLGERAALAAKRLNEGEDLVLDVAEGLVGGKLGPMRPAQLRIGKDRLLFLAAQPRGPLGILLALVETLQEQQERQLFDSIERIRKPPDQSLSQRASTFERRAESVSMEPIYTNCGLNSTGDITGITLLESKQSG
jgi:hypothetical protein